MSQSKFDYRQVVRTTCADLKIIGRLLTWSIPLVLPFIGLSFLFLYIAGYEKIVAGDAVLTEQVLEFFSFRGRADVIIIFNTGVTLLLLMPPLVFILQHKLEQVKPTHYFAVLRATSTRHLLYFTALLIFLASLLVLPIKNLLPESLYPNAVSLVAIILLGIKLICVYPLLHKNEANPIAVSWQLTRRALLPVAALELSLAVISCLCLVGTVLIINQLILSTSFLVTGLIGALLFFLLNACLSLVWFCLSVNIYLELAALKS